MTRTPDLASIDLGVRIAHLAEDLEQMSEPHAAACRRLFADVVAGVPHAAALAAAVQAYDDVEARQAAAREHAERSSRSWAETAAAALARACTYCGAIPGAECVTSFGNKAAAPHTARVYEPINPDRGE